MDLLVPIEELTDPVPDGITVMRAGVIPYTEIDGDVKWLVGINQWGDVSDFGGGCKVRHRERPIDCILRETEEEAGSYIKELVQHSLNEGLGIYIYRWTARKNKTIRFYLVLVPVLPDIIHYFVGSEEIFGVMYYSQDDLLNRVDIRNFHDPLRFLIRKLRNG